MAVNVSSEEGITHGDVVTQSATEDQERRSCRTRLSGRRRRKWPFRCFGSRNIFIILAWTYIMTCCQHLKENVAKEYVSNLGTESVPTWLLQFNSVVYSIAYALSCPIASLLAEVVVGRYKFISYALRAQWLLFLAGAVGSVCYYYLVVTPNTTSYLLGHYLVAIPAIAVHGAFLAVVIPLGLDQIAVGSNGNISSFIVWYLWSAFSAYSTADILVPVFSDCTNLQETEIFMIVSLLQVLLLSVGLILDFHFHHKLVKEPVTVNPVSHIFKVLKYAAKHKYPVQRSAFTYCENERPTRLDHGKSKYGGPFTTEQVEDVKTFWRVLVVSLVISMLYGPQESIYSSYPLLKSKFRSHSPSNCIEKASNGFLTLSSFTMYAIPIYELLIYPCLRNRGPSILQSAGIGAAVVVAASLYGITAEATREVTTKGTLECLFSYDSPNKSTIPFYFLVPLSCILGVIVVILYEARIKLVCAQAPYNMRSFLIGLSLTLQTIFRAFGVQVLHNSWRYKWFGIPHTGTCGIWFYLTNLLIALAISLLLSFVVRWYKARERDDMMLSQLMVEEIYYKYRDRDREI